MSDPILIFGPRLSATLGSGEVVDLNPPEGKAIDLVFTPDRAFARTYNVETHNDKEVWIIETSKPLDDLQLIRYARPSQEEINKAVGVPTP